MTTLISKLRVVVSSGQPPPPPPPPPSPPPLADNPILDYFELRDESGSAGPELVWRVFNASRKTDFKECSVFVFDKRPPDKWFKPKRKEQLLEALRDCVRCLERVRHPRMLQVIHSMEEDAYTMAFAAEPVYGSLANILAWHEWLETEEAQAAAEQAAGGAREPAGGAREPAGGAGGSRDGAAPAQGARGSRESLAPAPRPPAKPYNATEYRFIDFELSYGMLQIIEALQYLHFKAHQVHRNVSPNAIVVCKRGTWKLFGLEFISNVVSEDPNEFIRVPPWSSKLARVSQPSLDFIAPEVQFGGRCNMLSDVFSLGLVMAAVYNRGTYLIRAGNNPNVYAKQMDVLEMQIAALESRVPELIQDALLRMLCREPLPRPNVKMLTHIDYFKSSEVAINALQFLDVVTMKDVESKNLFYTTTLIDSLPHIPKKLRWQHVWPALQAEVCAGEVLVAVLQPILWMTNEANTDEFVKFVLPVAKVLIAWPKCIQATVMMLQNLELMMRKAPDEDLDCDLLPLLYISCESTTPSIQVAGLVALSKVSDYINDDCLAVIVLPQIQRIYTNQSNDVKVVNLILGFYEKVLVRLDRTQILESILPTLLRMRTHDPTAITRVVKLYKAMLAESKLGMNTEIMAKQLIPQLAPQTVNPGLNMDQFNYVIEIVYDMLDSIERSQRHKIKLEALAQSSPERKRRLLQHLSSDIPPPPFSIPNLRVEKRKTSSAEDMARKNSLATPAPVPGASGGGFRSSANIIGQWIFGSNNSTNNASDKNYLRVGSVLPSRRLSDNTLMTPKIRIAPSCASSPGGSPGGSTGLPIRRHSSIGPQERRGSTVKLSPPTANKSRGRGGSGSSLSVPSTSQNVNDQSQNDQNWTFWDWTFCKGGSMPNTSSSVPQLLASRRSSRVSSQQGLLQQFGSGMVRPTSVTAEHFAPDGPHWSTLHSATAAGYSKLLRDTTAALEQCPSLKMSYFLR